MNIIIEVYIYILEIPHSFVNRHLNDAIKFFDWLCT